MISEHNLTFPARQHNTTTCSSTKPALVMDSLSVLPLQHSQPKLRHHSPSQIPPGILLPSNKSRNCLREVGKRPGYFATSQFPTVSNLGHFSGCVICPTSVMRPKHLMPFPLLQEWEHPQFLCVEETL